MKNRVVVTGMGLVSPIGDNIQDFWKNLESGKNGIDQITHFDTDKFDVKIAGQSQIQLDNFFDKKEIRNQYLIVKDGQLAGMGAHSYSKGSATGGSEEATKYKKK